MPISRVTCFKIQITSREVSCPLEWMMLLDHHSQHNKWLVVSNLNQDLETSLLQIFHLRIMDNFSQEWILNLKWIWIKANFKLTSNNNNQWWVEDSPKVRIPCKTSSNFRLVDQLVKWTKWISYRTFKPNNKISQRGSENESWLMRVRKYTKLR